MTEENERGSDSVRLTEGEAKALERLKKLTKFNKKSIEEQRKMLPKLIESVRSNSERRQSETAFAHNVSVATKHEKRVGNKRRRLSYTFAATAIVVLMLVAYVLYSYVLVVNTVTVTGTARYDHAEIVAVSGIAVGDKLFSPSINEEEISRAIVKYFPYVKSVNVKKVIPNTVTLELFEEEAVFVSEIHGQYALISAELRVLELAETEPVGDYIKLRLPDVKSALAGQLLEFRDDMFDVALKAAAAIAGPTMREGTTVLDISDRFDIAISYGGRYKLLIGDINDIDLKLTLAFEMMKDEVFSTGNKGTIYLDNVNSPSVIIDNQVDLD